MTSPEPHTRQELVELAALDAFGLLDDYEAAHYTRSLLDAPATVQDDIRRLQAEIAGDPSLMDTEEPDPVLRHRVLSAVARAIDEESHKLAPLATIGRARARGAEEGRAALGASGQFWRAAAFVLAGVSLVMAYFGSEALREGNRTAQLALSNLTNDLVRLVGPPVTDFIRDPTAERIVLGPADPGSEAWATLFVAESGRAFLIFDGLSASKDSDYRLQATLADGSTKVVHSFDSTGFLGGVGIDAIGVVAALLGSTTWQVVTRSGEVVLASA